MSLEWRRVGDNLWELKNPVWPFEVRATVRKLPKQRTQRWYAHVGSDWAKFADKPTAIAWATTIARMNP